MKFLYLIVIIFFNSIDGALAIETATKNEVEPFTIIDTTNKPLEGLESLTFGERYGTFSIKFDARSKFYYIESDILLPDSNKYDRETTLSLSTGINLIWKQKNGNWIDLGFLGSLTEDNLKTDIEDEMINKSHASTASEILFNINGAFSLFPNAKAKLYAEYEFFRFQDIFRIKEPLNFKNFPLDINETYYFTDTYKNFSLGIANEMGDEAGALQMVTGLSYASLKMPFIIDNNAIWPLESERLGLFLKTDWEFLHQNNFEISHFGYRYDIGYGRFSSINGQKPEISGESNFIYGGTTTSADLKLFKNGYLGLESAIKLMSPANLKGKVVLGMAALVFLLEGPSSVYHLSQLKCDMGKSCQTNNISSSYYSIEFSDLVPFSSKGWAIFELIATPIFTYIGSKIIDDDAFQREVYFGLNFNYRF